jgi:hypothetical protein
LRGRQKCWQAVEYIFMSCQETRRDNFPDIYCGYALPSRTVSGRIRNLSTYTLAAVYLELYIAFVSTAEYFKIGHAVDCEIDKSGATKLHNDVAIFFYFQALLINEIKDLVFEGEVNGTPVR